MLGTAEAQSHGAITVVNAMATGKGAALGIGLWTRARVTVTRRPGKFTARNISDPSEDSQLARITAQRVFARFNVDKKLGAVIQTESNIPVAVGLKSSSAASNAVALATVCALGRKVSDFEVVRLGVRASLTAGVTITGALDDAWASYFGGFVATDNARQIVLKRSKFDPRLRVLLHVPSEKRYTREIDTKPMKAVRSYVRAAHREALRGNYWTSMTLNGLTYSMVFGYDTTATWKALKAGAVAAGLTGKGPAVAAVVPPSKVKNVRSAWRRISGQIIETNFNISKASASRLHP